MKKFLDLMNLDMKDESEVRMMAPLVLAYIGDALYEIYIRTYIIHKYKGKVNDLHRISTEFVNASAQALIVHTLEDDFSEEEWWIIKRGRNQKSGSMPKNASLVDYKYATGFECLLGYLYLMEREDRLLQIVSKAIEVIENQMN
ncbi:MAG: mini-ribonuclease [Candidatus Petromonas sp.]|jgi:ribonuclease-3 family protein|nr:mini-ribonuclease [Candidatus Petromonas sp.]